MRTYSTLQKQSFLWTWVANAIPFVVFLGLLILVLAPPVNVAPVLAAALGSSQSGDSLVRTDGIYYLTRPGTGGAPVHRVVRLYDDGTAVEAEVSGDPAAKPNWLDRDDPKLLPGRWTMEGNELVVRLSTGFAQKTRRGKLNSEGWVISDKIVFRFAPLSFPNNADKVKNRRPYFVGPGKGTRVFQYDAAGNRTGFEWQLEIDATDPDGDPITITWKVSNGSIVGEGTKVVETRRSRNGYRHGDRRKGRRS
jgi:hypothetical protein